MCLVTNYKLVISYMGDNYNGWQRQKNALTVQEVLENLLSKIFKTNIKLRYSSRTDSGVHAFGQVANFCADDIISTSSLKKAMNTQLPNDIVVKSVETVDTSFDARKSKYKEYKYLIDIGETRSPFRVGRYWRMRKKVDIVKIKKAILFFIGEKDFKSFMATNGASKNTVRNIYDFYLTECTDKLVFTIIANGFLKQMVRNIIGTIIEVGLGRFELNDLDKIFYAKDRTKAGITAPAYGLYLNKVFYEEWKK